MNVNKFLRGLDFLGDSPESIRQFRKLIVALAIAGKLDPTGSHPIEPDLLVRRAVGERKSRPKSGGRKEAASVNVLPDDFPIGFSKPGAFVRLSQIAHIEKGPTGITKASHGPYPLVVTASDRMACDHYDFDGAAAIVPLVSSAGHGKASLQRLHYQEGKFALGHVDKPVI